MRSQGCVSEMYFKMATSFNPGGHSPTSLSRTLEKVFDEAQHTGELNLSGRKLKEYPKVANKYDLCDTSSADLSKNRMADIPREVCDFRSLERLDVYHNVLRVLPHALIQLQALVHLNLSRNQLTTLPPFLSELPGLEVLHAANNKLVSLPEEIGKLERLMDLDVSCNDITHLPVQMGDLESLRTLNVRRNLLVELPVDISKLQLTKLDFSGNRISHIPCEYRQISTLQEFHVDHNPLVCPPANICTKGLVHIMKYLHTAAAREDRRRGVIMSDVELRRHPRKAGLGQLNSEEYRYLDSPNERRKRHTVDSGYSTTDSNEKSRWSPSEVTSDLDEANVLAMKAAEVVKEQRQEREAHFKRRVGEPPAGAVTGGSPSPSPSPQATPYSTPSATPSAQPTPSVLSPSTTATSPLVLPGNTPERSPLGTPSSATPSPYHSQHHPYHPHLHHPETSPSAASSSANSSIDQSPAQSPLVTSSTPPTLRTSSHSTEQMTATPPSDGFVSEVDLVDEFTRVSYCPTRPPGGPPGSPLVAPVPVGATAVGVVMATGLPTTDGATAWSAAACTPPPELHRQKSEYEARKQKAARLRREQEQEEEREREDRRRAAVRIQESQKKMMEDSRRTPVDTTLMRPRRLTVDNCYSASNGKIGSPTYPNYTDSSDASPGSINQNNRVSAHPYRPLSHSHSLREERPTHYEHALRRLGQSHSFRGEEKLAYANNNYRKSRSDSSFPPDSDPSPSPQGRDLGPDCGQWRNNGVHDISPNTNSSPKIEQQQMYMNNHHQVDEEFRARHEAMILRQRQEAARVQRCLDDEKQRFQGTSEDEKQRMKMIQKEAVLSYFTKRAQMSRSGAVPDEEDFSFSRDSTPNTSFNSSTMPAGMRGKNPLPPAVQRGLEEMSADLSTMNPAFTIRRQFVQAQEECDMIENLRRNIESRLKVTLPDDLPAALKDGVVLCHLANHIRPRSVSSIHVPSPAVPKLTTAKCRRNVENFLEACRRIGVDQDQLCGASAVLEEKALVSVAQTVQALLARAGVPPSPIMSTV